MFTHMRKVTKDTIRIYWRHARQYRARLAMIVACLALATAVEAVIPFFYKRFFDLLASSPVSRTGTATALTAVLLSIFAF